MTQRPGPGETRVPSPWLHLVGTGHPPCGVGDFGGQLIEALRRQGQPQETLPLEPGRVPLGEIWRAVGNARAVIANLPLVPWKRALIGPPSAFAIAFLRRRRRVAILHEWGSMHRLRRLVLRPLLLFADTIVLLSPQVRDELAADPVIGRLARRAVMMPLPPNITRPETTVPSALSARMRAAREGRASRGRSFRLDLSGQAAGGDPRHRRQPEGARRRSARRLHRFVHPRLRRDRRDIPRQGRGARPLRDGGGLRLCRLAGGAVRPVRRSGRLRLRPPRGAHRRAAPASWPASRPAGRSSLPSRCARTNSITIRASRRSCPVGPSSSPRAEPDPRPMSTSPLQRRHGRRCPPPSIAKSGSPMPPAA